MITIMNMNISKLTTGLSLFLLLAAAPMLTACSDDDKVPEQDRLKFEAITANYDTEGVVVLSTPVNVFDGLSTFTAYGYVYNTNPSKAPTVMDHIINVAAEANSSQKQLPAELRTEIQKSLIESYGAIYVRAFVTAYNGLTYYSNETLKLGDKVKDESLVESYTAPTYPDNYTKTLAGWNMRYSWNLSNVHDPSVVLADDGYYYMYQTDASWGNVHEGYGHFFCRRSKDLVNWEFMGATMQKCPDWCLPKINEMRAEVGATPLSDIPDWGDGAWGYWAPVVRKLDNGIYRMYYSIVVPGYLGEAGKSWGERGMIGMMETTNPADLTSWVDKGYVISSPTDKGNNWNVPNGQWGNCYFLYNGIDPSYIVTPQGEHWLIYGSWHSGIVALQINAETGKPLKELGSSVATSASQVTANGYGKRIYSRHATYRWQGSEGPEIVYNPETEYYYLFMAYDELDVPYNTRVLRSKKVDGPYLDITGADRTNNPGNALPIVTHPYHWTYSKNTWVGISHVAVWDDGNGQWYIASQARLTDPNANMLGHVRRLLWTEDGWPIAVPERYGAVPQSKITANEMRGKWDFIDITYEKGVAKEGVLFDINADGKCSGKAFNGQAWTFDEEKQTLTIGTQKFLVTRECDYDSEPRRATICFCAYSSNGNHTYWAKRLW